MEVVLLPGSLSDAGIWGQVEARLGFLAKVTHIDFAGLDDVRAMAERVLERAPLDPFMLAGFSLGGYVALEVVRRAPERVSHLALLDTTARADAPGHHGRRLANIARFARDPEGVIGDFVQLTLAPDTRAHVAAEIAATMARFAPRDYVAQQRSMMTRPDAIANLSLIGCPTLVMCGSEDRATPPEVNRDIAGLIPRATYVELPKVGHMTLLEAPREVAAALTRLAGEVP